MRSSDPIIRFASRLDRAITDAEASGLDAGLVCDQFARQLVDLSVDRFGIKGARWGLQILLLSIRWRSVLPPNYYYKSLI